MISDELGIELRDRFFAAARAKTDDAELRQRVDAIDPPPVAELEGLGISWYPTARRKALRFVDVAKLDARVRDRFARPTPEAPHLAAVFVDPRELSFRTYENIVPLDSLFEGKDLDVQLAKREKLSAKSASVYSFQIEPSAALRETLQQLDGLGLYVPPLDAGSRGGERYIFHSALLADALTAAVKDAMPASLMKGFAHVNPIFRCNRFEPTDANFHRHHDTPYFDAARHHVSRYTVLLYLTGGDAKPALDIETPDGRVAVERIGEFTAIVLDQRHAHEGAPYQGGRKVFLRTELIFEDEGVEHDPAIGALFAKAVYWTGQSVFEPELARHADAYYNQVAAAHWSGKLAPARREPFVHKQFAGVHFVANGHDFWFAKSPGLTLEECAAITLLDYFNCKLGERAFRDICTTAVLDGKSDAAWIPAFLAGKQNAPDLVTLDKSLLFPSPEEKDDVCCPFHGYPRFDATRHVEIVDLYERTQSFARAHIEPAPILLMGEHVALDPSRFVVENGRIHVTSAKAVAPVNFAACWNSGGSPDNYIDVERTVGIVQLLVPPITYRETTGCYHLAFDFFRNTWLVKSAQASVPVPKIRNLETDPEEMDEPDLRPWIDAVDLSLVREDAKQPRTAWWVDGSALMADLFSEREDLDDYEDESDGDGDDDDDDDDDEDEDEDDDN